MLRDLGDNVRRDLRRCARLELPQDATKLVSNLPYNVATPIVVESLDGLPNVGLWCVMVQREVADRFFARRGRRTYGAVSVLVQLVCERTGFHPVSRTVFRPRPNVDSALVAFRRASGCRMIIARVKKSSARRSPTVARRSPNSLELAGVASRTAAAAALDRDRPRRVRARGGARAGRVRRARGGAAMRASAAAKINLALVVGPTRADGKHEVVTVYQRSRSPTGSSSSPAPELLVEGFDADTLVRGALEALAARARRRPSLARAHREAPPDRGRHRRRQLRRSYRASARERDARTSLCPTPRCSSSRAASAPMSRSSSLDGPQLGTGDGRDLSAARPAAGLLDRPRRSAPRSRSRRLHPSTPTSTCATAPPASTSAARRSSPRSSEVAPAARPRRAAAERPRLVAARRRAARARRVPRRRHRRGPGRVRALPSQGPRAGGAARAEGAPARAG